MDMLANSPYEISPLPGVHPMPPQEAHSSFTARPGAVASGPERLQALGAPAALQELEEERLAALHKLAILDTQGEQQYDDLTALASYICKTPMALISLVDRNRQWFKSRVGVELTGTPRSESICTYTIQQPGLFVVEDAANDARFSSLPMVEDGLFRFYAGAPISTADGHTIGSLCVMDDKPRVLTDEQQAALLVLSRAANAYLQIRRQVQQLLENAEDRRLIEQELRENHGMLEAANRQLHRLAVTDALTGLPNRRVIEASLLEQQHCEATRGRSLSLLMIDVDHFKRVNDTHSHEKGDEVLQRVATVLRSCLRETDTISRYGGEEFVVLLRGTGHGAALVQAERLRLAFAGDTEASVAITVSIGVATASGREWQRKVSMLLAEADRALYAAKRDGRNCVRSAKAAIRSA